MGNNQIMLLQLPRTDYFFSIAWDGKGKTADVGKVLDQVAEHIYPQQKQALIDAFLALQETDQAKISRAESNLQTLLARNTMGRPGVLGRYLFPDSLIVARDLVQQLEIRAARQNLITALRDRPDLKECARLITIYFDRLLAWNAQTGWEKVIDTGIWTQPIYEPDKDVTEGISRPSTAA